MPRRRTAPDVCAECFPAGWPDGATAVGCAHGSWATKTAPAAEREETEEAS